MIKKIIRSQRSLGFRVLSALLCLTFALSTGNAFAGTLPYMPAPTQLITASAPFDLLRPVGLRFNENNPLFLSFILNNGSEKLSPAASREQLDKVMRYFLGALTMPAEDLWVNLSPYEDDIVCPNTLGETELGHDMLAQDYLLKQLTASLMYPESETGKKFWKEVYQKVYEKTGNARIPVKTFNKVWIVPKDIVVYQRNNQALIGRAYLKVLSEDDYYALSKVQEKTKSDQPKVEEDINKISSQVMREVIIPAIEKEVNTGKQFAHLRQIYNTVILAQWFKSKLKKSALAETYFDQNTLYGAQADNPKEKEKIFDTYMTAFKKGVYNYTRNDQDPANKFKAMRRQYISGGVGLEGTANMSVVAYPGDDAETSIPRAIASPVASLDSPMGDNIGRPPSVAIERGQLAISRAVPMPKPTPRMTTADMAAGGKEESKVLAFERAPNTELNITPVRPAPITDANDLKIKPLAEGPNFEVSPNTQVVTEDQLLENSHVAVIALRPAADVDAIKEDIAGLKAKNVNAVGLFSDERPVTDADAAIKQINSRADDDIRAMRSALESTGNKDFTDPELTMAGLDSKPAERQYAMYENTAQALRDFGVNRTTAHRTAIELAKIYAQSNDEGANKRKTEQYLRQQGLHDKVDIGYVTTQGMAVSGQNTRNSRITPKQSMDIANLRQLGTMNNGLKMDEINMAVATGKIRQNLIENGFTPKDEDCAELARYADQGDTTIMLRSILRMPVAADSGVNTIEMQQRTRDIVAAAARTVTDLKIAAQAGHERNFMEKDVSEEIKEAVAYDLAAAMPRIEGKIQNVAARAIVDDIVKGDIAAANDLIGVGFHEYQPPQQGQKETVASITKENEDIKRLRQMQTTGWVESNIQMRVARAQGRTLGGRGTGSSLAGGTGSGPTGKQLKDRLMRTSGKTGGLDLNAENMTTEGESIEFTKEDSLAWLKRFAIKGFNYEILSYNP